MELVLIAVGILIIITGVSRSTRGHEARDPRRNFSASERMAGFARAGNRCEHINILGLRCSAPATHADHHYPYSRGGATRMSNFVALCASHNLHKSNKVPTRIATNRLERHRRRYFPPGEPVEIVWRYRH